ncbi:MAG TPA: phytase, partial [Gemmatimonadota bacterium]|nr:phytase [Gemmatimonadota bacterium]
MRCVTPVLLFALTGACGSGETPEAEPLADSAAVAAGVDTIAVQPVVLEEVFLTERDTVDDVDSPAIWHGPAGQHWILTTAKATDVVLVNDAATGEAIRRLGGTGSGPGQLDRPNGIAVVGNTLFVVERDNARLQAFSLPELASLGTFGQAELRRP